MNIYFDTEFTGLVPNTTLISIGMVTEHGDRFYAEFTDYDRSLITPWIQKNVMNHLRILGHDGPYEGRWGHMINDAIKVVKGDTYFIRERLTDWLDLVSSIYESTSDTDGTVYTDPVDNRPIQLVADVCHYDMYLLCNQVFGGAFNLPMNVNPVCYDICQDIADLRKLDKIETQKRPMPLRRIQAGSNLKYSKNVGDWSISAEMMQMAFNTSREAICKNLNNGQLPDGKKHNALYDAEVVKMIYEGMRKDEFKHGQEGK